jgi:hypothetical protein
MVVFLDLARHKKRVAVRPRSENMRKFLLTELTVERLRAGRFNTSKRDCRAAQSLIFG